MSTNKFFVLRMDGTLAAAQSSLGSAMDYMGNSRMLLMGTPSEAERVARILNAAHREATGKSVSISTVLLELGLEGRTPDAADK